MRAKARYVRVTPRKARLVADQVRGLPYEEAQDAAALLAARRRPQHRASCSTRPRPTPRTTTTSIAEDMRISQITVDEGPTIKRWRARARGRATRIDKRTSHISLALTPVEE